MVSQTLGQPRDSCRRPSGAAPRTSIAPQPHAEDGVGLLEMARESYYARGRQTRAGTNDAGRSLLRIREHRVRTTNRGEVVSLT